MSESDAKQRPRTAAENTGVLAEATVSEAAKKAPKWLKPYLEKLAPVVGFAAKMLNIMGPYFSKAWALGEKAYAAIEPYGPKELAPMFFGVILMLFGGYFMTLIACIEAYRISGWEATQEALKVLYSDYCRVKEASDKDDLVDDDGDGVADVLQISKNELVTRKLKVFAKSTNPEEVSKALGSIYTGVIAMMATLKMQFARTVALGVAIGDVFSRVSIKFLHAPLAAVIPKDYHRWIDVVIRYICKSAGISIAWTLQRILSAFHSALRGAQMFTDSFAVYTGKRGYTKLSEGYWDEAFSAVVAAIGLYLQLTTGFSLPWILALPLFPFLFVEKMLALMVVYDAY